MDQQESISSEINLIGSSTVVSWEEKIEHKEMLLQVCKELEWSNLLSFLPPSVEVWYKNLKAKQSVV